MSRDISQIDSNFAVPPAPKDGELTYIDARTSPFDLYGLLWEDGYARMPRAVAQSVSQGTVDLYRNTSGGRLRFVTDSPRIAVRVQYPFTGHIATMPKTGASGFDLYRDGLFFRLFLPPVEAGVPYETSLTVGENGTHEYEINFPLYNDVDRVEIGLVPGSVLRHGKPYTPGAPIVFYGSSITQGACSSRPGTAYANILSRRFNRDILNLGFSGNAKGETAMADYIAALPMSVFVCDYDHNAPTCEHLASTHRPFVERIRRAQPDLPILFITRPDFRFDPAGSPARREVVRQTFLSLRDAGDKRIAFVDGESLWDGPDWDGCTVDSCHPNDLGMWRMSQAIGQALSEWLSD